MRPLKFRTYDTLTGKFYYWGFLDEGFVSPVTRPGWIFTHEQFTGLYDKNGKELYEGDIVKSGDFKLGRSIVIEWGDVNNDDQYEAYVLGVGFELFEPHDNHKAGGWLIIGNVHENKGE